VDTVVWLKEVGKVVAPKIVVGSKVAFKEAAGEKT